MLCGYHPNIFAAKSLFPRGKQNESACSAPRSGRNHRILRNLQCSVNLVFCIGAITNRDLDGGCPRRLVAIIHTSRFYVCNPRTTSARQLETSCKWLLDADKSGPLLDTAFSLVFVSLETTCQRPIILSSC